MMKKITLLVFLLIASVSLYSQNDLIKEKWIRIDNTKYTYQIDDEYKEYIYQSVKSGHQPWRLNKEEVAFLSLFDIPDISVDINKNSAEITMSENGLIIMFQNRKFEVALSKYKDIYFLKYLEILE